jgi:hypothetical protein
MQDPILTIMKKVFIAAILITLMASCDVYYVETAYDNRNQITGYYDVEDFSKTYDEYHYYGITISKVGSVGSSEINIRDLYAEGVDVYAYLEGNSIEIPFQTEDGYEIEGSGYVSNGTIHLSYRVKDRYGNGANDFCELYAD